MPKFLKVIAALAAGMGLTLGVPFALLGFAFQFIRAAFQTGQGFAAIASDWIDKQ